MPIEHFPMFLVPFFKTSITPWENKKKKILDAIDGSKLHRKINTETHLSDYCNDDSFSRNTKPQESKFRKNTYSQEVWNILFDDVNNLFNQINIELNKDNPPGMWSQKYYKGDYHSLHNHGHTGYSLILYLKFNPKVHKATKFYGPFHHFFTGDLLEYVPSVKEGDIIMFPSAISHESQVQESSEERMILSFNIM